MGRVEATVRIATALLAGVSSRGFYGIDEGQLVRKAIKIVDTIFEELEKDELRDSE